MRVSEIRVKRIRVNQGLGVLANHQKYTTLNVDNLKLQSLSNSNE